MRVSRRSILLALAVGVISLMTLSGLILAVVVAVRGEGGLSFQGRIALIEVEGVIADEEEYLEQIRKLRGDGSVKGFVVAINSPGGAVAPTQSIYRELRRIREEDHRPVIASIGGVGASGGYYIALAADSIFALPGSITGSIGALMEFPNARQLMEKLGVEVEVVKSGEHKDLGSPFRPISPDEREILGAVVEDVYEQFVEVVAKERSLDPEVVRRLADGRIFSGRQARERGLVDRLGNRNDALAAAGRMAGLGDDPKIVRPPKEKFTLLELLLGQGAAATLADLVQSAAEARGPRLRYVVPF